MERRRDLRFRDFSYQDLTSADFAGADLTGSNFTGAILRNVDFSGISSLEHVLPARQLFPAGSRKRCSSIPLMVGSSMGMNSSGSPPKCSVGLATRRCPWILSTRVYTQRTFLPPVFLKLRSGRRSQMANRCVCSDRNSRGCSPPHWLSLSLRPLILMRTIV